MKIDLLEAKASISSEEFKKLLHDHGASNIVEENGEFTVNDHLYVTKDLFAGGKTIFPITVTGTTHIREDLRSLDGLSFYGNVRINGANLGNAIEADDLSGFSGSDFSIPGLKIAGLKSVMLSKALIQNLDVSATSTNKAKIVLSNGCDIKKAYLHSNNMINLKDVVFRKIEGIDCNDLEAHNVDFGGAGENAIIAYSVILQECKNFSSSSLKRVESIALRNCITSSFVLSELSDELDVLQIDCKNSSVIVDSLDGLRTDKMSTLHLIYSGISKGSLANLPKSIKTLYLPETYESLVDISEINDVKDLAVMCSTVKKGGLGVVLMPNLKNETVSGPFFSTPAGKIIRNYIGKTDKVYDCQTELMEAGLEAFTEL